METSPLYPAPTPVATRPKTAGASSTIGGVEVPTHHSHGTRPEQAKKDKQKANRQTRLLNPMSLLTRRRSQAPETFLSEESLDRQKSLAVPSMTLPDNFDPRIRGKIVHDFSAPRPRRNFSYNDADRQSQILDMLSPAFVSSPSAPQLPPLPTQEEFSSPQSDHQREESPRRSQHTPVFVEHFTDDVRDDRRSSSIRAEELANKNFLSRASYQSANSQFSQESAILPPFARRSQQMDPLQASFLVDTSDGSDGKRSSDPNSSKERDSTLSSISEVSPVTGVGSSFGNIRQSAQSVDSPVSPASAESSNKAVRPPSDTLPKPASPDLQRGRSPSESTARPLSEFLSLPLQPAVPDPSSQSPPASPPSIASQSPPVPLSPTKITERRASARGHSKRNSFGGPKHRVSTASRFSFQLGGSAAEEKMLEEKHRKISGAPEGAEEVGRQQSPGEDEEEYFDENAMYDHDEMESVYSEGEAEVVKEEDLPYIDHPAMRTHSALDSRPGSMLVNPHTSPQMSPYIEDGFSPHGDRSNPFKLKENERESTIRPRSGFYMQPTAAGYSPKGSPKQTTPVVESAPEVGFESRTQPPPLPHRDSGHSERNRVLSGLNFGHKREESSYSGLSLEEIVDTQSKSQNEGNGLGLSGFGDFRFDDGPDLSLKGTPTAEKSPAQDYFPDYNLAKDANIHAAKSSDNTIPQFAGVPYHGTVGKGIKVRSPAAMNQNLQYAQQARSSEDTFRSRDGDDMYFDDGGFQADKDDTSEEYRSSVDEDAFDDPAFLKRNPMHHTRDVSGLTVTSMGSDGPYPTFAMPNPAKARQRDSEMLLEDLVLQVPVDPKWIPQRNPSEDAKRLGLSNKVPPLPPRAGSSDGFLEVQANLMAYHAALAEAANKAATEGRFLRAPSNATSVARSASVYSNDAASHYSQDEAPEDESHGGKQNGAVPQVDGALSRDPSDATFRTNTTYSPPKMSFDFGFDNNTATENDNDDYDNDDDLVAAANAEALANDDGGFYGQEFGFYAKPRPNSGEGVEAIDGGYFGEAGIGDLNRQKSLKEPNLTPITERSEFSTRTSYINLGPAGAFGMPSASTFGPMSPGLARLPVSPLAHPQEEMGFDQLRKLRGNAFGGSNGSLRSEARSEQMQVNSSHFIGKGPGSFAWGTNAVQHATQSPSARSAPGAQGYFGSMGGTPMVYGYSTESSGSGSQQFANDSPLRGGYAESQESAARGDGGAFDVDATPRKLPGVQHASQSQQQQQGRKAQQAPLVTVTNGHARTASGGDSVTYVREQDPSGKGPAKWVLERRRTSELGERVVGREVVQGGWI